MKKQISHKLVSVTVCSLVICFAVVFYAFGWMEPTVAPPGGNVAAPLNVGSIAQSKVGGVILNTGNNLYGLIVNGDSTHGYVGIGTTGPGYKLDVENTSGNADILIVGGGNSQASLRIFEDNSGTHNQYGARVYYEGLGNNFFNIATTDAGTENIRMSIDRYGNVGIGTTTPSTKLDVAGTIKATGLQITTGAGAGKVLTSDASGTATWQTPSAVPPITIITCATKVRDNGFTGSSSAACPAGTVIRFFAETGHAEHNTDWNDDQYCRTWVSQATYGIQCNVVEYSAPGCGGSGMGVCW